MSSSVDIRQRPGIWSYFSFNSGSSSNTTRNRRNSSVSLPRNNSDDKPHDKYARSSAYSRRAGHMYEEKGMMHPRQKIRYIKAGGVIGFILLVLFFLIPGERQQVGEFVGSHTPASFRGGDVASDPSVGTTRCSKSYSSKKPIIQYVLMIDAGSTGSRIHVYKFNNCGPTPELEDEIFEQTHKPDGGPSGLSSYKEDAEGAAKSLDPLMDVAMKNVPERLKGCTPVAVKATAGLRKLGDELSNKILKAVRHRLETEYPFPVLSAEKGGVEVMDGKYEAVYAWITTNYLLGKIGGPDQSPTAAVFDLGGGSTQIVFEPTFKSVGGGMPEKLAEGDHKYELDFGGRSFQLYQHSYLGYGLMAARNNIHAVVIDALLKKNGDDRSWLTEPIVNPCIIPGLSKDITVELPSGHALGSEIKVKMTGPQEGSISQCQAIAEKTLKKDADCKLLPCAFNGVHQPALEKTFSREDLYLFSYFYDRIKPLGVPESFTVRDLRDLAQRVCQGKTAWDVFDSIEDARKELEGRPEHCLDLNFMFALLHLGYEIPLDREVKMAKKIKGNELGWCLGASLPLLEQSSGWQCKIREV